MSTKREFHIISAEDNIACHVSIEAKVTEGPDKAAIGREKKISFLIRSLLFPQKRVCFSSLLIPRAGQAGPVPHGIESHAMHL